MAYILAPILFHGRLERHRNDFLRQSNAAFFFSPCHRSCSHGICGIQRPSGVVSLRRCTHPLVVVRIDISLCRCSLDPAPSTTTSKGQKTLSPQELYNPYQRYKYIAKVAYDGTRYAGFQAQGIVEGREVVSLANRKKSRTYTPTIQGELERALENFIAISRHDLKLQGAGRTDAGVHARGQAIHFFSKRELGNLLRAVDALNALLPLDIRVLTVEQVPLAFNVRFSSGKTYTYDVHTSLTQDPFTVRYRHVLRWPTRLDLDLLNEALDVFVGTRDFEKFSSKPRDGSQRRTLRTIHSCFASRFGSGPDEWIRISVQGDGFLYKQVRHMVGAALSVGYDHRLSVGDLRAAVHDKAVLRPGAYVVAEAKGLCLDHVVLPDASLFLNNDEPLNCN